MKKSIFFLFLALSWHFATAQESQTVYNFLRLPVSAHASSLGGENITVIEDDAAFMHHNPALLQNVSDRSISLGYMNYMSGVGTYSAGYAFHVGEKAVAGVSAQYLNYGKMKEADTDGNVTGDFNASDFSLNATLSHRLAERVTGGVTARFVYSSITNYHSTAAAVDLGLNYYDEERELSASVVAKNLGGQLSAYNEDYEKMPADLQAGISKTLTGMPLRLSVTATDLTHWDYSFFRHLTIGADLMLSHQIYLAAGYSFRRSHQMSIASADNDFGDNESSHGAGLSFGAGIALDRFNIHVSYAKYHVSSSSLMVNIGFGI